MSTQKSIIFINLKIFRGDVKIQKKYIKTLYKFEINSNIK